MVWPLGGDDALDFERWLGEVQDEAVLTASGPEVGANHREVDILESLDRFELHGDQRSHQQVQPMKPNLTAAIQDRHGSLPLEANTPRCKLESGSASS
jgi:hypothetical protein